MGERESSRDIDRAASEWAARMDRGPLSPDDARALEAWLQGDVRRRGALLRAEALALKSESARALGPGFDPDAFAREEGGEKPNRGGGLSRRRLMGIAAAFAVASVGGLAFRHAAAAAEVRTGRGEIRLVPLPDGSTVLLNTESCIRIRYGESERCVTLVEGEAYFSAAREQRPFVVEAGGERLSAERAAFRVMKLPDAPLDILVNDGEVDIGQDLRLTANTRVRMTDAARPQTVAPDVVTRELAWREGRLSFEGETLAQAAAEFSRYSDSHIRITDPALAREPVTGLFAASDPVGFSHAAASIFGAKVTRDGKDIVIGRAVSG